MPAGISAYVPLANVTIGVSATQVIFSSISQDYRDLVMVAQLQTASGTTAADVYFNNDNLDNRYPYVVAGGNGSAAQSNTNAAPYNFPLPRGYTAISSTTWFTSVTHIMDYAQTNKHKAILHRANNVGFATEMAAVRWANTAALNNIKVVFGTTMAAGSTISLYGVSA